MPASVQLLLGILRVATDGYFKMCQAGAAGNVQAEYEGLILQVCAVLRVIVDKHTRAL